MSPILYGTIRGEDEVKSAGNELGGTKQQAQGKGIEKTSPSPRSAYLFTAANFDRFLLAYRRLCVDRSQRK